MKKLVFMAVITALIMVLAACSSSKQREVEEHRKKYEEASQRLKEIQKETKKEINYLDIDEFEKLTSEEREKVIKEFAEDGISKSEALVVAKHELKFKLLFIPSNFELTSTDISEKEDCFIIDFYGKYKEYDKYKEIKSRNKYHLEVTVSKTTGNAIKVNPTLTKE